MKCPRRNTFLKNDQKNNHFRAHFSIQLLSQIFTFLLFQPRAPAATFQLARASLRSQAGAGQYVCMYVLHVCMYYMYVCINSIERTEPLPRRSPAQVRNRGGPPLSHLLSKREDQAAEPAGRSSQSATSSKRRWSWRR